MHRKPKSKSLTQSTTDPPRENKQEPQKNIKGTKHQLAIEAKALISVIKKTQCPHQRDESHGLKCWMLQGHTKKGPPQSSSKVLHQITKKKIGKRISSAYGNSLHNIVKKTANTLVLWLESRITDTFFLSSIVMHRETKYLVPFQKSNHLGFFDFLPGINPTGAFGFPLLGCR